MGLQITRVLVRSSRIPPEMDGYRAAVLADLHNCSLGDNNRLLRDALVREDPEVLLVAGDMVTESYSGVYLSKAHRLLRELSASFRIYYSIGNHELRWKYKDGAHPSFEEYKKSLTKCGVTFLENASVWLNRKGGDETNVCGKIVGIEDPCEAGRTAGINRIKDSGKDLEAGRTAGTYEVKESSNCGIRLTGLDLPPAYYRKKKIASLGTCAMEDMVGVAPRQYFNVLLAHSPQYFDTYSEWGADLTLSGHFHGGIIRLPFIGGVVSPYLRLFPKYDKGIYQSDKGGGYMVLTAGLGTHTFPRFNNPPELVLITFGHCEGKDMDISYT